MRNPKFVVKAIRNTVVKRHHQTIFRSLLLFVLGSCFFQRTAAQSIQLVPYATGSIGSVDLLTYQSLPVLNNELYFFYSESHGPFPSLGLPQLAKFNGTSVSLIPNPTPGSSVSGLSPWVLNNSLYMIYVSSTTSPTYELAQYNSNGYTLFNLPNGGLIINPLYLAAPLGNSLYFQYLPTTGLFQLARFDGAQLTPISNPPTAFTAYPFPFTYNNNVYTVFPDGTSLHQQLQKISGNSYILVLNPDNGFGISSVGKNIIYKNKLPLIYVNAAGQRQLAQYNDTAISLIVNPDAGYPVAFYGIYNDKLYFLYRNASSVTQLASFDGTSISLIPNPDIEGNQDSLTIFPSTAVYNNKFYFRYQRSSGISYLAQFDGNNLTLIPNPDAGLGYFGRDVLNRYAYAPTVFNNKLFIRYKGADLHPHLAQFDGTALSLIQNLPSHYLMDTAIGYAGSPVVYKNRLYFSYLNDSGITRLAYLNEVEPLPVSLFNFSAKKDENNSLLSWQTASEENTSHFIIQRSTDGKDFTDINKIPAAGNSNSNKAYAYTDANVTALKAARLFYRLRTVDKDGSGRYSDIRSINLNNGRSAFSVSPNPAHDFVAVLSSRTVDNAQIKVTDLNGKLLYITKQNFVAGQQLKIPLSPISKQVLILTIESDEESKQFKIVK